MSQNPVCACCNQRHTVGHVTPASGRAPYEPPRVMSSVDLNAPAEKPVREGDQPLPVRNNMPAVWDMVMDDIRKRDVIGEKRYGTRLQPFNGRDALRDAYEEALDLVVYLRQAIHERDASRPALAVRPDQLAHLHLRMKDALTGCPWEMRDKAITDVIDQFWDSLARQ